MAKTRHKRGPQNAYIGHARIRLAWAPLLAAQAGLNARLRDALRPAGTRPGPPWASVAAEPIREVRGLSLNDGLGSRQNSGFRVLCIPFESCRPPLPLRYVDCNGITSGGGIHGKLDVDFFKLKG